MPRSKPIAATLDAIGWPDAETARRLNCSRATVNRWRSGRTHPSDAVAQWLEAVARAVEGLMPPPPVPMGPKRRAVRTGFRRPARASEPRPDPPA